MTRQTAPEATADSPASKAFATRLAKYAFSPGAQTLYGGAALSPRSAKSTPASAVEHLPPKRQTPVRAAAKRGVMNSQDAISDLDSDSAASGSRFGSPQAAEDPVNSESEQDEAHFRRSSSGRGASGPRSSPHKRSAASSRPSKRVGSEAGSATPRKAKKIPRPYADPEMYSHLQNTPDHLAQELSIIFCGINPGKKSAATQTHFAHPTNKFWRALHQSGLTPRLYAPSECHLLPSELNFGLTNLCGRPTSEQSELSTLEMRLNVHPFTLKIVRCRPRIVCFIGKKIWEVFEGVAKKTARAPPRIQSSSASVIADVGPGGLDTDGCEAVPIKEEENEGERFRRVELEVGTSAASHLTGGAEAVKNEMDGDAFDPAYGHTSSTESTASAGGTQVKEEIDVAAFVRPSSCTPASALASTAATATPSKSFDWFSARPLRLPLPPLESHRTAPPEAQTAQYTYFWVTPSTSGLERTPMAEQVRIFTALRDFSERLQAGYTPPDEAFRDIELAGLKQTSDKIRSEAIAKGKTILPSVHAT